MWGVSDTGLWRNEDHIMFKGLNMKCERIIAFLHFRLGISRDIRHNNSSQIFGLGRAFPFFKHDSISVVVSNVCITNTLSMTK